jgi:hypothetical protein
MLVKSSSHIEVSDLILAGSKQFGLALEGTRNVTVENSLISDVKTRGLALLDNLVDKEACVTIGALDNTKTGTAVTDTFVRNTIAAGCPYVGFATPSYPCDETGNEKFYGNVAHSVDGCGAHIYPDPGDGKSAVCYEGSHFSAYKNQQQGLATHFNTNEQRFHDMVFVDNQLGVSYQIGGDRDDCLIKFYDSYIFGESDDIALDCVGDDCLCVKKNGLTLFGHNFNTKSVHITGESALPLYKVKSEAGWGMAVEIERVTFQNFKSDTTLCGSKQRVFHNSKSASDYIPMHELKDCTFIDVDERAFA